MKCHHFYFLIGSNHYKIDIANYSLTIWKHRSDTMKKHGFWIYVITAKIKHGKLGYNWGKYGQMSIPSELKNFCERTLANKAFW